MEFLEAKKIESQNLKETIRRFPRLFEPKIFIDDQKFLDKYGIFIPEKKKFPQGYLKLWPQDFIVEEITLEEELQTVFPEKFLHKKREFLPEDPIIYATLVKCGLSTIEAVEELANGLRMESRFIKYGGMKDKHAITSQLISIKNSDLEKLNQISVSHFFVKNIFSGERELFLGGLKGNQFTILVRTGPNFNKEEFLKRLKEVEKNGFFNFYYIQRFGVPRLISPYCGLYILKGDYEKTVFTQLCKSIGRESFYFQNIRREIEKLWGNWEEIETILDFFPLTFRNEIRMIKYLIENPNDFIGALNQVPKQVLIWVDAFLSLLFNKMIYHTIKENQELPPAFPLLNQEGRSWLFYKEILNQVGIFSSTFAFKNLKPFPATIRKRGGERKTRERVKILDYRILPMGVILNFILPKGCYATSFLSHLFNLVSGALPPKFSNLPIDTKANLGQPSLEEILNKFSDVVSSPAWRLLWRIY